MTVIERHVIASTLETLMTEQRSLESRCADLEVKCASLQVENQMLRSQLRGKRR